MKKFILMGPLLVIGILLVVIVAVAMAGSAEDVSPVAGGNATIGNACYICHADEALLELVADEVEEEPSMSEGEG